MAPRPRCSLLLLQMGAAASCICVLAASCPVADAAPLPLPSRDVPVDTAVASAADAAVPRTAVEEDDHGVLARAPDDVAGVVLRGARRLGLRPPRLHLRLSDTIPADAPAATSSSDTTATATAPSGAHAATSPSLLAIFSPVFFILGCGLFVAGLFKSADLCAAAKVRRQKARCVRPLGHDAIEAAGQ